MNKLTRIFFYLFIISPAIAAQNYLIIQSQNSIFVPLGSQICSDYIIVNKGASYITEDTNGTCNNTILTRLGKAVSSVELLSFEAGIDENQHILLTWKTVNEKNDFGFNIERFNPDNQTFEKIGFIPSHRNSYAKNTYSFIDKASRLDRNYNYRLIQVNNDNSSSILNTIKVNALIPQEYFLSQNYPNPFNPSTKINYRIPVQGHVMLKIYDVLGNEVSVLVNEDKPAGNYEVTFDLTDLPSGIYFYELTAGNFIQTKKMILIR